MYYYLPIEADFGEENGDLNLLTTICNYPNSSTSGVFPHLTEILDHFEVINFVH